jgi:hypothetical protein
VEAEDGEQGIKAIKSGDNPHGGRHRLRYPHAEGRRQ